MRHKKPIIISILLVMSPHFAFATEPGPLDVLFGFFIAFLCFVVIPIIIVGLALRKSPSEKIEALDTQARPMSSETPADIELKEISSEEIKVTEAPQKKPRASIIRYFLIIIAVLIALGPFLPRYASILRLPYDILFMVILYGFPVLIPLVLVSLFLAARRRNISNKQPPI